jgi:DNA-directed RNA polymerase subunit delta
MEGCVIMESITSRVSYLSGLIEGLSIDKESKEGKIITEISSILKYMAEEIEDVKSAQDEIEDYVDAIDEDLNSIENEVYGEDEDDFIDVECPNCGETIYVDADLLDERDNITCPKCNNIIKLNECNCCDGCDED